jgi:pyruvate formate lyase activating enzyme
MSCGLDVHERRELRFRREARPTLPAARPPVVFEVRAGLGSGAGLERVCRGRRIGVRRASSSRTIRDSSFEAKFYQKLPNRKIKCKLCPRECTVGDKERGYCGVRENRGGVYYTLVHSRVCAAHVDPIEKKPLFHYLPGTTAFSLATAGCNVNCKFCQNWDISQSRPEQIPADYAPPQRIADWRSSTLPDHRLHLQRAGGLRRVSDGHADAGTQAGVRSIVVSNGYMQQEALKAGLRQDGRGQDRSEGLHRVVLQREGGYRAVEAGAGFAGHAAQDGQVDGDRLPGGAHAQRQRRQEFRGLAQWIKANLGPDVPLHFTQFHPEYLLKNLPITPVPTLERAKAIADAEGLHYVYIGNVPGPSRAEHLLPAVPQACWWSAWDSRPARC